MRDRLERALVRLRDVGGRHCRRRGRSQRMPCQASTLPDDCGTWAVSASWAIPEDAVSGVYVARLVREDGETTWRIDDGRGSEERPGEGPHAYGALGLGELRNPIEEPRASHIVFVVRDDASQADIVVQTSDPSWAAYNEYGLGSSYRGFTVTGDSAGRPMRAHKVSYNRPLMNRDTNSINQLFDAESIR